MRLGTLKSAKLAEKCGGSIEISDLSVFLKRWIILFQSRNEQFFKYFFSIHRKSKFTLI